MAALKQSFEQTTPSRRQLGREHPFELDALHHNLHPFSSKACQLTVSTGKPNQSARSRACGNHHGAAMISRAKHQISAL